MQGNTSYMLQAFGDWKAASGASYKSTADERQRYANFVSNMLDIARINDRAKQGSLGFWVRTAGCSMHWLALARCMPPAPAACGITGSVSWT